MTETTTTEKTKRHQQLAKLWCEWNNQRGTAKQIAKIRCTEEQLERMLGERGVVLQADGSVAVTRRAAAVEARS